MKPRNDSRSLIALPAHPKYIKLAFLTGTQITTYADINVELNFSIVLISWIQNT